MLFQHVQVEGLLVKYEKALMEHGWSHSTRYEFLKRACAIVRKHERAGLDYLDPQIIADHTDEISRRFYDGKLSRRYFHCVHRGIKLFASFAETGQLELPNLQSGSRQQLTEYFEKVADDYLSLDMHPNTRNDARWVVHKYFAWLDGQGFGTLTKVGAEQIQKFLLHCASSMAMGTMHDVKIHLKKLYVHLHESGLSKSPYLALLSFKVNRETKLPQTMPRDEIAKMLGGIDKTTVAGKRAYAAMLLGTVLGLRACDVAGLKLADIDWVAGELKIVQSKTSCTVVQPLTRDVGEAIKDYILNARPKTNVPHVFVRLCAPFTEIKSAVTVGEMFLECCNAVGLDYGKRFHILRRSLATSMITAGSTVDDVGQVLGVVGMESTKKYLAFDTENLKLCALPFDGIMPKGGGLQ